MADESPERPPVICAGVVVADHLCTPIDHLPASGELVAADELILALGGCASNAAVDLAKQGVRSSVVGRIGDDIFGRFIAETLGRHGVETIGLRVDPDRPTSQTLIVNVKGQDRRFIHSFGANRGLSADDLDRAIAEPPRVLYVGGFLILPNLEAEALAERFARLRKQGTMVVLDVATPGPGDYLRHLRPVLPETDVFLPNTDEAALILGQSDPIRQAETFHAMGARHVVITMGDSGAIAVSDRHRLRLGTYPMSYVDGSGGGDAFDAGYIAGLLQGRDEMGCLRLASALGASCVRAVGTTAGVFNRAEAEEFLDRHELLVEPL